MRVIAGKYKGRKLNCLSSDVRPTLDRVKVIMFDIIQFDVANSVVLDLFSGSGAIAIECLSRGCDSAYAVDISKQSCENIKQNAKGIDNLIIINSDYMSALNSLKINKFDLIFIDPPFDSDYLNRSLEIICKLGILDGTIICEHSSDYQILVPSNLNIYKTRKIGNTTLTYLVNS